MKLFFTLILHELVDLKNQFFELLLVLGFYITIVTLFVFGIGIEKETLSTFSIAIIWTNILVINFLSFSRFFETAYSSGILDQYLFSPLNLEWCIFAKAIGQIITYILPLLVTIPILMILLNTSFSYFYSLMISLTLGMIAMLFLNLFGSALLLGSAISKFLFPLIIVPFYIPILIFGISASSSGHLSESALTILGGITLVIVSLSPFATAEMLKISLEDR